MMYNYPFFGFPRFGGYPRFYYNNPKAVSNNKKNEVLEKVKISSNEEEKNSKPIFEVFGVKLYFDDILIICLIFFLYQEGVQDEYLFTALILLLLS